jgi:plasmid stability protein
MPSLLIRNLDDSLHATIKQRARANRRSMEAEAREMLKHATALGSATSPKQTIIDIANSIFGPIGGVHLDLPPRGSGGGREPLDFSGPEYDP